MMNQANRKNKKMTVTSLALAVAVLGSAFSVSGAYAASSTTKAATTAAATTQAAKPTGKEARGGGHLGAIWNSSDLTTLLGLTADELKTQREAGKSLADIATSKGVDKQKVIDLIAATLTKDLDKRLADGTLTQAKYDEQKAKVATQAAEAVNNTGLSGFGDHGGKGGHGGRGGFGGGIDIQSNADIASLLGLTTDELATQLKAGKSLADLATAKGVATDTVTTKVTTLLTAALDKQLADGKITQAKHDEEKAKLADRAAKLVSETFKDHGGKGGRGGFGGGIDIQSNADIASLLGLTTDELATQLKAGKSLADLATAKGVATDTVTAKVTTLLTAALDKQLADGKITQAKHDEEKAEIADHAAKLVSGTFKDHGGKGGHGRGGEAGPDDDGGYVPTDKATSASSSTDSNT